MFVSGSSTVVVRSEGAVAEDQEDVLGVYRLVDSHQDRPLYQQAGGENFLYFSPPASWLVGTVAGGQYGWLRNVSHQAATVTWPADLAGGWQYRDRLTASWREDDLSLRVQPLPGEAGDSDFSSLCHCVNILT